MNSFRIIKCFQIFENQTICMSIISNLKSIQSFSQRMTCAPPILDDVRKHFNSHPHKEDDVDSVYVDTDTVISTHILTRRMTQRNFTTLFSKIFQLTSSQGG